MKKIITVILLVVLTYSCSDAKKNKTTDDTKTDQTQDDTYLKAKIDGVAFYAATPHFIYDQKIISLAGISKDKNEKIRIYINYTNGPATYAFGKDISNSDNLIYTNNKVHWLAAKIMGEGTITITEEGAFLIGKFNFTGINKEDKSTKQITDGEFKVRLDP
ncbi:DUF6252 family protein [Rasiella sp. SM2506]|uniref:DUF6252 family protein n=1 Tax=Rasiella sp. SM2506 TaxID=3423914 RepID=UPI003D7A94DC